MAVAPRSVAVSSISVQDPAPREIEPSSMLAHARQNLEREEANRNQYMANLAQRDRMRQQTQERIIVQDERIGWVDEGPHGIQERSGW